MKLVLTLDARLHFLSTPLILLIFGNPPASVSQMVRLQVCTIIPGSKDLLLNCQFPPNYNEGTEIQNLESEFYLPWLIILALKNVKCVKILAICAQL